MSLRFITRDSGIREMKDVMSRQILGRFREAGIGIASGMYDIAGLPPVRVIVDERAGKSQVPKEDENGRR